jgi:hypothetical protein
MGFTLTTLGTACTALVNNVTNINKTNAIYNVSAMYCEIIIICGFSILMALNSSSIQ